MRTELCLLNWHDNSYSQKEFADFFVVDGEIANAVKVAGESGRPTSRALQESVSDGAVLRLVPASVGNLPKPKDPNVARNARTIQEMCHDELGREPVQSCLSELQALHGNKQRRVSWRKGTTPFILSTA